jgi:hypothetical protein
MWKVGISRRLAAVAVEQLFLSVVITSASELNPTTIMILSLAIHGLIPHLRRTNYRS